MCNLIFLNQEHPIRILEETERKTRNRNIKFIKVQWSKNTEDEATWEREDQLRQEYPDLFLYRVSQISGRDFC